VIFVDVNTATRKEASSQNFTGKYLSSHWETCFKNLQNTSDMEYHEISWNIMEYHGISQWFSHSNLHFFICQTGISHGWHQVLLVAKRNHRIPQVEALWMHP
jgi:hypothetical protein